MTRFFPTVMIAGIVLPLCSQGDAWGAEPTTAECLAASERSLKFGTDHRVRAERAELLVCAASSCPKVIRTECVDRVAEVNAQIPTILISAKDAAGADLTLVRVSMDGVVLTDRLDGTAIAVDPGEHTFSFETPGQPAAVRRFLIQEGQKDRREVVTFGAPLVVTPGRDAPSPSTEEAGLGKQRIAAIVVGGVGVVGLGVGAVFGVVAMSQKSAAQNVCSAAACPTQDGVSKWSSAATSGNISTVGFIIGGVAAAGAGVLWFTAPRPTRTSTAQLGIGPGTIQLKGTW